MSALAPAAGENPLAWLARLRKGSVYQPTGAEHAGADPNGCLPKLALIAGSGYALDGRSLLSLGSAGALYELRLASDAAARGAPPSAVHLVDTEEAALASAGERAAPLGIGDFRTFSGTADQFAFARDYDACFFLSLFHHYDRLGGATREQGFEVLRRIGARCRTLFFETGQTNDAVPGSAHWPRLLEMAGWESPQAWLEARVPQVTGYDRFHCLGTNPVTNRHLYVYWRSRPDAVGEMEPGSYLRDGAGAGRGWLSLAQGADGEPVVHTGGGAASPLSAASLRGGRWFVDCRFTGADADDADRALVRAAAALAGAGAASCTVIVRAGTAVQALPDGLGCAAWVDGEGEDEARRGLVTAALSGFGAVCVPEAAATPALLDEAARLGVRVAVAARGDGGTLAGGYPVLAGAMP